MIGWTISVFNASVIFSAASPRECAMASVTFTNRCWMTPNGDLSIRLLNIANGAAKISQSTLAMGIRTRFRKRTLMNQRNFYPAQAQELAEAFARHQVDYMFIWKSGAILLGYPGTTQDVDVYPRKDPVNGSRIVAALMDLGFALDAQLEQEIVRGKDFVQIKSGPFDIDLVFAPDGIESYDEAKSRMDISTGFPVLNISDIIASKRAARRAKDKIELPLLEAFRKVYEQQKK